MKRTPKNVEALYTGGGIWDFCGKTDDGKYFLTDNDGNTIILDKDVKDDLDNAFFPEWEEEHKIEELQDEERVEFCKAMLAILKMNPIGGISLSEIERFEKRILGEKTENEEVEVEENPYNTVLKGTLEDLEILFYYGINDEPVISPEADAEIVNILRKGIDKLKKEEGNEKYTL